MKMVPRPSRKDPRAVTASPSAVVMQLRALGLCQPAGAGHRIRVANLYNERYVMVDGQPSYPSHVGRAI